MKNLSNKCLNCRNTRPLVPILGVCTYCRQKLFDNGGISTIMMTKVYNISKSQLKVFKRTGALIPDINSQGSWKYPANRLISFFKNNENLKHRYNPEKKVDGMNKGLEVCATEHTEGGLSGKEHVKDLEKSSGFKQIREITISKKRMIVISKRDGGSYWFNEKVKGTIYTGFTQKGFGLNAEDYDDFKAALLSISSNNSAVEKRFKVSSTSETVVYHPYPDTVDIRQFISSERYTGWTKKGIRVTNENAKKIAEHL